jgi:hypothetical protein
LTNTWKNTASQMERISEAQILYTPRPDATPEAELDVLAAVYRYLLLEKGGPHDLTSDSTKDCTTRPEQKGKDNADLHGHGL